MSNIPELRKLQAQSAELRASLAHTYAQLDEAMSQFIGSKFKYGRSKYQIVDQGEGKFYCLKLLKGRRQNSSLNAIAGTTFLELRKTGEITWMHD